MLIDYKIFAIYCSSFYKKILSPKNLIFSGRETIVSILNKPKELTLNDENPTLKLKLMLEFFEEVIKDQLT